VFVTSSASAAPPVNEPAAHALLRSAYAAAYRYPSDFGGFQAHVEVVEDTTRSAGRVDVRGPRAIQLDLTDDAPGRDWLLQELASMVGHRWAMEYEQADGRFSLSLGPEEAHPLGRLVRVLDDPYHSTYRVLDGQIVQIDRQMGGMRFSICVQARTFAPDGRALPGQFSVAYWDTTASRLTRADTYMDEYASVDGVYLPVRRCVVTADDTGLTTRELRLSQPVLNAPASPESATSAPTDHSGRTRAHG
jgi:hypothetical protein